MTPDMSPPVLTECVYSHFTVREGCDRKAARVNTATTQ
jgi:hypothetical protein